MAEASTKKTTSTKSTTAKAASTKTAAPKAATEKKAAPKAKAVEVKVEKQDCLYLQEVASGKLHQLTKQVASWGGEEYVLKGNIAKGKVKFVRGEKLDQNVPAVGDDHGYTLEGKAQELFVVKNALNEKSECENRSFNYINNKSTLEFVGNAKDQVSLYVRVYDNEENNRWVVIYAE